MTDKPTTDLHDKYITITHATDYSMPDLMGLIDFVGAEARRADRDKVLIDVRGMRGSMTEADRFMGGKRMAEVFGPDLRVAILMPPAQITHLGEIAAQNRGARVHVFADETEGLAWLLAGSRKG